MDDNAFNKLYVNRPKAFGDLVKGLTNHSNIVLEGQPGMGKTFLARYFSRTNPLRFESIFFFDGILFNSDVSQLERLAQIEFQEKAALLIIDGFDEIKSEHIKKIIIKLLREGRKKNIKVLIITRPLNLENIFENNAYKIQLGGLTEEEAYELIAKYLVDLQINSKSTFQSLTKLLVDLDKNPLLFDLVLRMIKEREVTIDELNNIIGNDLSYKNELIVPYSQGIILPEKPQIIEDVSIINASILDRMNYDPHKIYDLSPRQFEELVGELFEKKGYKIELTRQTRDGGKDLMILHGFELGDFLIYAECKKYAPDNPVGVKIIRELYGTISKEKATAGLIVTSSYFSPDAISFTEDIKHQMSLVDFVRLSQLIKGLSSSTK